MDVFEQNRARVLAKLDRHLERLVERMVAAIVDEIPHYRAHPDPLLLDDLTAQASTRAARARCSSSPRRSGS
jgi:hypothetical protein